MSAAAIVPAPLKWVNAGISDVAVPEPVVTYLTALAASQAIQDSDLLLGMVEALLRQGSWGLAFTDDSLASIIQRCHRAIHVSSVTDFICMIQYLQLVFKVSRHVLHGAALGLFTNCLTYLLVCSIGGRTNHSPYPKFTTSLFPERQMLLKLRLSGPSAGGLRRAAS